MSRRSKVLLALVLIAAAGATGLWLGQIPIARAVTTYMTDRNAGIDRTASLPDGLHVFICGAGSPMPDPLRAGPCTGIVAGEHVFVVDTGAGSVGNLARMGFPLDRIQAALLTHLHSDHLDGLGEFLLQSWINGSRRTPTPVHGPVGVGEVVAGFNAAYRIDSTYRLAHHGPEIADTAGFGGLAREIRTDAAVTTVLEDGDLKITAVAVNHHPADPALGYRFDYRGRSVTISGDTVYHPGLVAMAKSTDLLLHDALNTEMVEIIRGAVRARGRANIDRLLLDIQDYHASPRDAARAARDAGAKALVLHHVVPPLPSSLLHPLFLAGTGEIYGGQVSVAQDGQIISLPAGNTDIVRRDGFSF